MKAAMPCASPPSKIQKTSKREKEGVGIAALHEGQGGNPWSSFSFERKHRSPVALGKWDSPCGTVGPDFGLRRAERGKAGMFRPFFVSCVESAKGWGWSYVEKVAFAKHLFVLKRYFYERCALAKKGRYAIPGRKNLKEAIMIDFKVDESLMRFSAGLASKIVCIRLSAWTCTL